MQTVHYSAATVNSTPPMTALSSLTPHHFNRTQPTFEIPISPATSDLGEDNTYTTQYYTTLHPPSEMLHAADSPHGEQEDASSQSNSSSSDSDSSGGDGEGEREAGECMAASLSGGEPVGATIISDSIISDSGEGAVKNWTYEDQFKQLYNLTPEKERREFLDKLFSYMQNKEVTSLSSDDQVVIELWEQCFPRNPLINYGTPITRIPIMAKQPLDLYKLFKLVVERGGLVEVIKKKAWRNVAKELNLPASITSAAFTMRSQYVKYLYPYECEVAELSSPQELQLAIESNKRDRRHSDTVDFLSPQIGRSDLEQVMSPVGSRTNTGGNPPQGLQLITSPTVAMPHGAMPPFSGGFIVTGGNGGHQVVQMAHHIPGIPIMVPGTSTATGHAQSGVVWAAGRAPTMEERQQDEDRELSTPPAAKKIALDMNSGGVVTLSNRLPHGMGNFIVTPGGSIVQHPSSPQLIQMAGHHHIPIVIPSPVSARTNGKDVFSQKQRSPLNIESHSELLTSSHMNFQQPSIVRVTQSQAVYPPHVVAPHIARPPSESGIGQRSMETGEEKSPSRTTTNMPFANISIQSAGGRSESGEGRGDSLLVTMEINNVVFQGVLFAKPQQKQLGSPNSK